MLYVGSQAYKPMTIYGQRYDLTEGFTPITRFGSFTVPTTNNYEVPYDAEIEYLESSGSPYIDTGIYITKSTTVEISHQVIALQADVTDDISYFSCWTSNSQCAYCFRTSANAIRTRWGSSSATDLAVSKNDMILFTVDGTKYVNKNVTKNTTKSGNTGSSYPTNQTFRLFAGTANRPVRIYYAKVGNLDLIPVRVGQVGYMYDKVSGQLFGNAGTDNFILGPDVAKNPKPFDSEVEYIQTDGNQYIELPFKPNEATDCIEFTFRRTDNTTQHRFCTTCTDGSAAAAARIFEIYVNGNGRIGYNDNATWREVIASNKGQIALVKHTLKFDYRNGSATLDYGVLDSNRTTGKRKATENLKLFCGQLASPSSNPFIGLIYGCKIWRNDQLIYDLIPVRKNGVGYLFDTLSETLFGNAGTGNFTIGYDKLKDLSQYTIVDYIENNTQVAASPYIDADIASNQVIEMGATIKWNTVASNRRQLHGMDNSPWWGCDGGKYKQAGGTATVTPSTTEFETVSTVSAMDYTSQTLANTASLAIFRLYCRDTRGQTTTTYICSCKIKRFHIKAGGVLVRDFVAVQHPCGRYGFFDLVSNRFFDSANSGVFLGG